MPGLSLPALLTGPGKPIWAPSTGAGMNWPGLANAFHGESTSGLQWLCSPTILLFFFSLLNSKTIPQMSYCLISVLMNISGSTTSPPAVTREPQAMLSRCCLCALSSGCSCQPRQGSEEGNRQGKSVMAFPGPSSPASNRSRWVMKGAGLCPCLPGTPYWGSWDPQPMLRSEQPLCWSCSTD